MFPKLNLQNLIPMRPLLNEDMLAYEAANQGFLDYQIVNRDSTNYMIYCYAYSQIEIKFAEDQENEEESKQVHACFRVLLSSLIRIKLDTWDTPDKDQFVEIASNEFQVIQEMQREKTITGGYFNRVRAIRDTLQKRGYYSEVSTGWRALLDQAWTEMVIIIEEDQGTEENETNIGIWQSIIDKTTSLN